MSLWGNKDDIFSGGTITINYATKTVTGSGTTFTALTVGDVISVGTGSTYGQAIVSGITSDRIISIGSTQYLSGQPISAEQWTASQAPKYILHDSHWPWTKVYGVDPTEVGLARTTIYSVDHGGWVGITTYIDSSGSLRTKTEVLVAMSSITTGTATTTGTGGDAADDTVLRDV